MDNETKYLAYKILPELELILEYQGGAVKGDDAIRLRTAEKSDDEYDPGYNVLIDFRDIEINWTQSSDEALERFINFIKCNPDLITSQKTSLLIAKPEQAVLSTLIKEQYSGFPMRIDVYSTLDAALINLNVSREHFQRIERELLKIRNEARERFKTH